ncbi:PorP/SprF family type IX secretion system membrane protein [Neptunitalea chrysea]|nr:type IX secretion system membrane protein PorP/SprF [Neptunitalea chrysea]
MNLKKYFLLLFLTFSGYLYSQEGLPVYLDYLTDNYYLVHPAMAGAGSGTKVRMTARQQWFGVDQAPALQTIGINSRMGDRSALGAMVINDRNGYHSQTGVKLTYAHHISLDSRRRYLNQLSFGLSAVVFQGRLDESEFFNYNGVVDNNILGTDQTSTEPNVDIGMAYAFGDFYAQFSVLNVLKEKRNLYSQSESGNKRRVVLSTGYTFGESEWSFQPSVLFQYVNFTKESTVDLNFLAYKKMEFGRFWGGLSYRSSLDGADYVLGQATSEQKLQLISPVLGVTYNNFMFGYTYSYQMGDIKFQNGGYHQITLGLTFGEEKEAYHCNCPFNQ